MADDKQSGGVNTRADGDINVGRDVVGRDNIETVTNVTHVESSPIAGYAIIGIVVVATIAILAFALTRPPSSQAPVESPTTILTPTTLSAIVLTPAPSRIETSTPVPLPTVTPIPVLPPAFTTEAVISMNNPEFGPRQIEFNFEPGMLPTETITDFLKLSRVALVQLVASSDKAFDVRYVISNTGSQPLMLDLDQRFFRLEDDQGREAELVYFCCATKGDILPAGQARNVQLIFRILPEWIGKGISAQAIFLRVRGLLPVVRASWQMPTLATAD